MRCLVDIFRGYFKTRRAVKPLDPANPVWYTTWTHTILKRLRLGIIDSSEPVLDDNSVSTSDAKHHKINDAAFICWTVK